MTILDEKETTVSLKLIVAVVSIVTIAGFATLYAINSVHTATPSQATQSAPPQSASGNI